MEWRSRERESEWIKCKEKIAYDTVNTWYLLLKNAEGSPFGFLQSVSRILINDVRWLYLGQFWPLLNQAVFLEAARAVLKIGFNL